MSGDSEYHKGFGCLTSIVLTSESFKRELTHPVPELLTERNAFVMWL